MMKEFSLMNEERHLRDTIKGRQTCDQVKYVDSIKTRENDDGAKITGSFLEKQIFNWFYPGQWVCFLLLCAQLTEEGQKRKARRQEAF